MVSRRAFLRAASSSLLVAPLAAEAQLGPAAPPKKAVRTGVLYPGADNQVFRANFDGFRRGLGTEGYVEGRNLTLDIRFGDGRELPPLAGELVNIRPNLLHAVARPGVVAIHAATSTIPVVALDLESSSNEPRFPRSSKEV